MGDTNSITKIIISLLMMIGGAPSSTSGGIRITSIAIIFLTIRSALRNKKDVISFYKKIDFQTIKQALTNIFISSIIVFIAILLFVKIQDIELSNVLFMWKSWTNINTFNIYI